MSGRRGAKARGRQAQLRLLALRLSLAILAAFVPYNVVRAVSLQDELPPEERLDVSPRSLVEAALGSRSAGVRGRTGVFYYVAERIAGADVMLPPEMREFAWEWEHVARIRPDFGPIRYLVVPDRTRRLRTTMPPGIHWLRRDKSEAHPYRAFQDFYVAADPATREYVLAESEDAREAFLIPATRYEQLADPRVGLYFYVARRIAGATVTLPPAFRDSAPDWERAGRVRVRLGDRPLVIPGDRARKLRRKLPQGLRWLPAGAAGAAGAAYDFYLAVDRSAREYVLVESPNGPELFLLPPALHARLAAPPEARP